MRWGWFSIPRLRRPSGPTFCRGCLWLTGNTCYVLSIYPNNKFLVSKRDYFKKQQEGISVEYHLPVNSSSRFIVNKFEHVRGKGGPCERGRAGTRALYTDSSWTDRQTRLKTLPSRNFIRVGNKSYPIKIKWAKKASADLWGTSRWSRARRPIITIMMSLPVWSHVLARGYGLRGMVADGGMVPGGTVYPSL